MLGQERGRRVRLSVGGGVPGHGQPGPGERAKETFRAEVQTALLNAPGGVHDDGDMHHLVISPADSSPQSYRIRSACSLRLKLLGCLALLTLGMLTSALPLQFRSPLAAAVWTRGENRYERRPSRRVHYNVLLMAAPTSDGIRA